MSDAPLASRSGFTVLAWYEAADRFP